MQTNKTQHDENKGGKCRQMAPFSVFEKKCKQNNSRDSTVYNDKLESLYILNMIDKS